MNNIRLSDEQFNYLLQEGLTFLSWGWSIFPVKGKYPLYRWHFLQHKKMSDASFYKRMMKHRNIVTGIAVINGAASPGRRGVLTVRDFDNMKAYERWAEKFPEIDKACPTSVTSRGVHKFCYTTHTPTHVVKFGDGELRGSNKGYVVLPGSFHQKGWRYCWRGASPSPGNFPIYKIHDTGFIADYSRDKVVNHVRQAVPTTTQNVVKTRRKPLQASLPELIQKPLCPLDGLDRFCPPVREAILKAIPHKKGTRNDCLLYLTRLLKDESEEVLYAAAAQWYSIGRLWNKISSKDESLDEVRATVAWYIRRRKRGLTATSPSESGMIERMKHATARPGSDEMRLLRACATLPAGNDGLFYLGCRTAGEVLGCGKTKAHKVLAALVDQGWLEVVENLGQRKYKRKATVFRFTSLDVMYIILKELGVSNVVDRTDYAGQAVRQGTEPDGADEPRDRLCNGPTQNYPRKVIEACKVSVRLQGVFNDSLEKRTKRERQEVVRAGLGERVRTRRERRACFRPRLGFLNEHFATISETRRCPAWDP